MTNDTPDGARRTARLSAFFSPIADLPFDPPGSVTGELGVQLRRDEAEAYRQVLARHRWVRAAFALLVGLAAYLGDSLAAPVTILAAVVVYVALVHVAWFAVQPGQDVSPQAALTAVGITLAADVLLPALLVSMDPVSLLRLLSVGTLVTWGSAYFFSWRFAVAVMHGTMIVYLVAASFVATLGGSATFHAVNLALFAAVTLLVVWAHARQRRFYAELHVFCRQVARGDIGIRLALASSTSGNAVVRLARDVDAMRRGLAEQIGVDALTGCLNRRALESRLRGEWRLARRRNSIVAVAAIDVDHFKQINDTHGHAAGDEVLRRLSVIMKECGRESDAVARIGGDEFVMILPDTSTEGARSVAERVRERVARTVFGVSGQTFSVTLSMGAVAVAGRDDIAPSDLLNLADRALYESKQKGRNRVSFGTPAA